MQATISHLLSCNKPSLIKNQNFDACIPVACYLSTDTKSTPIPFIIRPRLYTLPLHSMHFTKGKYLFGKHKKTLFGRPPSLAQVCQGRSLAVAIGSLASGGTTTFDYPWLPLEPLLLFLIHISPSFRRVVASGSQQLRSPTSPNTDLKY